MDPCSPHKRGWTPAVPTLAQSPSISCQAHLLAVLLVLNGVHSTAGLGVEHEVKAGVFTEATGIAQEGILLIVIDGPERQGSSSKPAAPRQLRLRNKLDGLR